LVNLSVVNEENGFGADVRRKPGGAGDSGTPVGSTMSESIVARISSR
jgi:hypothetical protein